MKNSATQQPAWLNPLILLLTLVAAIVHLSLNFIMGQFDVMFTLNGLGYLGLLAALYLDLPFAREHRRWVRLGLMGFIAATLISWIILGDKGWWLGLVTATLELILLFLLSTKRP